MAEVGFKRLAPEREAMTDSLLFGEMVMLWIVLVLESCFVLLVP